MDIPFFVGINGTISASGQLDFSYQAANNEIVNLYDIRILPTGTASIIDIRDSGGRHYANFGINNKIPTTFWQVPTSPNIGIPSFRIPLVLQGSMIVYITLLDTSAATNATVVLLGGTKTISG